MPDTSLPQHTDLSSIGELGLIRRIAELVDTRAVDGDVSANLVRGIGDDAAVFRPGPGNLQLLTTDALIEGVHFDLTYTSMKHLGWKSVVASISDIAAMAGEPRYALVALAIPQKISVEMAEEFYRGAAFACKKHGGLIVGGDTAASLDGMMVTVAMTGEVSPEKVRYRSGAKPGDYLCVSGHLGASVAGLKVLQREKARFAASGDATFRPNLDPYREVLEKHLMPTPRTDLAKIFAHEIDVNALIDISDGLASEVGHLCEQSNTGAAVWEHNLPLIAATQHVAGEFAESPTEYALFGGEEYELLFSISEAEFAKLERLSNDVTVVGRVTKKEQGIRWVKESGEELPMEPGGWNHFGR
jgi:thiamine-monophosphate kinase